MQMLASNLLDGYDEHISPTITLWREMNMGGRPFNREENATGLTGLRRAAYFGCVEIHVALLEMEK